MTEAKSFQCPECGAPKGPGNSPSCDCAQRASDALRDARTAEAAAAEDFNPLRIRPYVEIEGSAAQVSPAEAAATEAPAMAGSDASEGVTQPIPAPEVTMPLRPVAGPSTTDLRMFEPGPDEPGDGPEQERRPRPSRRALVLSAAGAVVTVVAAAGFASGLFSYETPSRDGAAPREVRESVPEATTGTASERASTAATSARPTSASPSPSASASTSPTPSPTPSASRATPSAPPSRSATPTQTATVTGTQDSAQPTSAPVLRRGDHGPEVTELQLRLRQLNLYIGDANGNYGGQVEDAVRSYQWARGIDSDEPGVYGAATRAQLEKETEQP
ncbi:peptidoglycan-binding domain-containing protein [Streptomyces sp. NPDC047082]|uniref:peptidoglycan-binding domain-containing protein n=1 Tax=Streptomyces sp. NPDC047082 TaxID=3155259 RepID=UPI0033FAECE6